MNSKRDEILGFLERDLLPQVKEVLAKAQGEIGAALPFRNPLRPLR